MTLVTGKYTANHFKSQIWRWVRVHAERLVQQCGSVFLTRNLTVVSLMIVGGVLARRVEHGMLKSGEDTLLAARAVSKRVLM